MSLTDGDVALLARQVVDLLDPNVDIQIDPATDDDPYRWGQHTWQVRVLLPERAFDIRLVATMSAAEAIEALVDGLSGTDETRQFRDQAFPPCPGHPHAARLEETGAGELVLRCPETHEIVGRFVTAAPA
jgi:hypothetical protein